MSQLTSSTHGTTTLHDLIMQAEQLLRAHHKQDASIDARLLMCHVLGCGDIQLILNRNEMIGAQLEKAYRRLIAQRIQGVPLQYITKSQEFMALEFYVDERVLIPRQDTETLVEAIIEISKKQSLKQIVEIGAGSGCISVALAHYIPGVQITAIDISQDALDVTLKNAVHHGVNHRITCIKSDLLTDYKGEIGSVDLIVSNPPYISKEECQHLMQEVEGYEPKLALTDGADGLTFYRKISKQVKSFLKPSGILAYEIGYNQAEAVTQILISEEFKNISIIKDLPGQDRVIIAML